MATNPVSDSVENVIAIKRGRGGARPGAGRPPLSPEAKKFRDLKRTRYCVYIIHEESDPTVCKIGIAKDPYRRLSDLQIGSWRKLKIAALFEVGNQATAEIVEKHAHGLLRGVHEVGEWFRVSPDEAQCRVVDACSCLGADFERV